jgi:hypothetical protein
MQLHDKNDVILDVLAYIEEKANEKQLIKAFDKRKAPSYLRILFQMKAQIDSIAHWGSDRPTLELAILYKRFLNEAEKIRLEMPEPHGRIVFGHSFKYLEEQIIDAYNEHEEMLEELNMHSKKILMAGGKEPEM